MTIEIDYWINYKNNWYIVTELLPHGCKAIKITLKENGDYKLTKIIRCFTDIELSKCRLCEY